MVCRLRSAGYVARAASGLRRAPAGIVQFPQAKFRLSFLPLPNGVPSLARHLDAHRPAVINLAWPGLTIHSEVQSRDWPIVARILGQLCHLNDEELAVNATEGLSDSTTRRGNGCAGRAEFAG